ncbi:hypothetical protein CGCF413_v005253 [Colletotrichum fructicola]|nr:hypothetical protein CGCF413_v005253 [Colletotrichum fructicola]
MDFTVNPLRMPQKHSPKPAEPTSLPPQPAEPKQSMRARELAIWPTIKAPWTLATGTYADELEEESSYSHGILSNNFDYSSISYRTRDNHVLCPQLLLGGDEANNSQFLTGGYGARKCYAIPNLEIPKQWISQCDEQDNLCARRHGSVVSQLEMPTRLVKIEEDASRIRLLPTTTGGQYEMALKSQIFQQHSGTP